MRRLIIAMRDTAERRFNFDPETVAEHPMTSEILDAHASPSATQAGTPLSSHAVIKAREPRAPCSWFRAVDGVGIPRALVASRSKASSSVRHGQHDP
jgi:hypothetical protein